MELLNAKSLVSEAKAQETREAPGQSVAKLPDEASQASHSLREQMERREEVSLK